MSGVVAVASFTFVGIVVALGVVLRKLRRTLELEAADQALEERFVRAGLVDRGPPS